MRIDIRLSSPMPGVKHARLPYQTQTYGNRCMPSLCAMPLGGVAWRHHGEIGLLLCGHGLAVEEGLICLIERLGVHVDRDHEGGWPRRRFLNLKLEGHSLVLDAHVGSQLFENEEWITIYHRKPLSDEHRSIIEQSLVLTAESVDSISRIIDIL